MDIAAICRKTIFYSFYGLFLLIPLVFSGSTSELFELNKILILYVFSLIILLAWGIEIIVEKQIKLRRTPFDIPVLLFLASQCISTIISLDPHVSFWGYYSRFNGGLLSLITYFFLYYAFVSHAQKEHVLTALKWTIVSGLLVAIWGLPSHFGKDPTCYLFRNTFDVSCWTEAFKPTIRMFSTLGQPAWLAAFMSAVLPITLSFFLLSTNKTDEEKKYKKSDISLSAVLYFSLSLLFYLCLLYANTRAGFISFWIANVIYWTTITLHKSKKTVWVLAYFFSIILLMIFAVFKSNDIVFWFAGVFSFLLVISFYSKKYKYQFVLINLLFLFITFFAGSPLEGVHKYFSFESLKHNMNSENKTLTSVQPSQKQIIKTNTTQAESGDLNITDSGNIRQIVWKGAIDAWKANPIFGTGVETFAFAYYQHRPKEHNLTSEWDYLYNKAHNEFFNYLTTTGIVGLGTYLFIIGSFFFYFLKLPYGFIAMVRNVKENHNSEEIRTELLITVALVASYVTILITNFFGFSVVIMNLLLFLSPAFAYVLTSSTSKWFSYPRISLKTTASKHHQYTDITVSQWSVITILFLLICYFLFSIYTFWEADKKYGLGYNLNRAHDIENAYLVLTDAVTMWPSEPVFQDELSLAAMQLGFAYYDQKNATAAAHFIQEAANINDKVLAEHPKYLPFWKTRVRMFYTLSQLSPQYNQAALQAAQQAAALAPTDARIWYNLGVMYGQSGNPEKGVEVLKQTLDLKPDYQDAYKALALMYREQAVNGGTTVLHKEKEKLAEDTMEKLLQINPEHTEAKKLLGEWRK